ncbi:MAG: aminotransferase class I/II-fold pyridoxal phosphate-dependent enzyme, partial [Gordonia sp. (in: high G+C Gram-positive bacteria)]
MQVSRRAQQVAPFYAMEFAKKAAALEAQGHPVIRLNIGEPDFGPPPAFLDAARELTDGRPLTYTDALGTPQLRAAIADFYSAHFRARIEPGQVAVTAGASAALLLACAALIDPGDEVLIGDPSYPCNRQFAESFGARVHLVPTTPRTRYQLTPGLVEDAWTPAT